jgi:BsuBI/PstI restriction endonuclease domain/BsuBI/PstI restriction endonuclease HTH domain
MAEGAHARRIVEARDLLKVLNFDAERSNERSALVLLALLDLPPDRPWADASNPPLRTVEIMEWLRQNYGKDYKPNTRETIRRFTLHQFADAGLVVQNPDCPDRPINSPKWCYQVSDAALDLVRRYGRSGFPGKLHEYLSDVPGLLSSYTRTRAMRRIPVTLPDGAKVTLSPGGQNILIKQIIEDFCAYYTPGGHVLYVGDADAKWLITATEQLARLGVVVDEHGKMPDVVVHLRDRNWLVLMEAATSHGPIDAKRFGELRKLFAKSSAGLVFVSCFPSREEMRKYLHQIAWETEVWCADNPTHLIHFNGERFLGPYE